ncbi:MAG: PadR family transcriptional regulator [Corynebacterium sp.]|uniref:PadR family transcriptional regulator n=1 Tax=Corynebacterium sp. TaxID=1720 RepID=UPI003F9A0C3D
MGTTRTPQDIPGIRDFVDAVRGNFHPTAEPERNLRTAILAVLAEQPQHGHQIIRTITDRSDGDWEPSPAEVYPTLQLLVDEELATVEEQDGRRLYSATDAGQDEATTIDSDDGDGDWTPPWPTFGRFTEAAEGRGELPKAGTKLAQAVHQAAFTGDGDQRARVTSLLDETRRKVYGILAEEPTGGTAEDTE